MTVEQNESVLEDCVFTATAGQLRMVSLHKHLMRACIHCAAENSRDDLLHSTINQIKLD